jgi:hypothetical protein
MKIRARRPARFRIFTPKDWLDLYTFAARMPHAFILMRAYE